jgi:hypothetical protein
MKSALRFLVFVCVAALCLTNGCRNSSSQESQEKKINLFNMKRNSAPGPDISRQEDERTRRILQGFRDAGNPDVKREGLGQALWHSTLLLAVIAVVIAGLFYWQKWQEKRMEWEVNDPMALVHELNFVHQISEPDKRLMQELSKKNAMSSPLKLFIEPKFLLAAWDDDSFISSRSSVERLLSKLFDITTEVNETTVVSGLKPDTIGYSQTMRKGAESK